MTALSSPWMRRSGKIVGMSKVFKVGEHICAVYETEAQQLAVAAEYLADGLRAGHQVMYVAESAGALGRFREMLKVFGIMNLPALAQRGALIEATHAEAHLADARFDRERMLAMLNRAVEDALAAGFSGLRTCGDMSWLLLEPEGADQVVEYEALLNRLFDRMPASGMCQYDRRRLPAHLIDHALATHSTVVLDQQHMTNHFYQPPEVAVRRTARPGDVAWKLAELRGRSV